MTQENRREFNVTTADARTRLDRFLAKTAREFSRSRIQTLIRQGHITVNGVVRRARDMVRAGDRIALVEPPIEAIDLAPENVALSVLFEDDDLIVINKPAGISVHPGAGHKSGTLVNALLSHCQDLSGIGGKERPGIVHRLDKETSGCLVVAKNDLHVFSGDLQPLEPAIFGDDVTFGFFRAVDRREARDDAVGRDHSQDVETPDDRAGVGYESLSLAAPALAGDMRVG